MTPTRQAGKSSTPAAATPIAVGLDAPIEVKIKGSTGYYCGGMNKQADILVEGSVGPGVA
jgi:glutamate synthase domain-containing protein 3